ncbi:MAG: MBL fold metallo-hydrolase, partial [Selenomonadaceae bacterium]|nr:MBL fold metallo-hydrolase [Selenomonadaceae bacterium]
RGTKQIGGSITEISMGRATVLVDCGGELPGSQGSMRDEEIIKKIVGNHRRYTDHHIDAVFFTHYHGDHVGLVDKIPADIPLYMDEAMLTILRTLHKHTKNIAMQELLSENNGRIRKFTPGKLLNIGDMNVIPFFVDHSAYHANMFLFENKVTGHTVLHSGDFRGTGYMSKSLDMIPRLIHENYGKQVDALISEGTMMNRSVEEEHLLTEWDVHKEAKFFMKDHRQIFVACSSTNFDSLTSICNAAKENNILIYGSPYIIEMLKTFSDMAGKYTGFYRLPPIKGLDEMKRVRPKEGIILLGSLLNRKAEYAYTLYDRYGHYMSDYQPHLIYSMWQGYLNPKHPAYDEGLSTFVKRFGSSVKYIHSTGHTDKETLAKFIENVAPRKYIIPLHTENAAGFRALPIEDKYKDMIVLPDDGDTIEIA